MSDPAFWAKSAMRGGGGLFGDFLFADQNRYGGGIVATLTGPVLGSQLPKAIDFTLGNLQELVAEGEARKPNRTCTSCRSSRMTKTTGSQAIGAGRCRLANTTAR